MLSPLFLIELLSNLGLGQQIFVAVILLFVAFETTRVLKAGRRAGGFMGSAAWYLIIVSVVGAGAILLGWVDPNPGAFLDDVITWGGNVISWLVDNLVPRLPI